MRPISLCHQVFVTIKRPRPLVTIVRRIDKIVAVSEGRLSVCQIFQYSCEPQSIPPSAPLPGSADWRLLRAGRLPGRSRPRVEVDDVAGYQIHRLGDHLLAVPHDLRLGDYHFLQGLHRVLCLAFLYDADHRVDNDGNYNQQGIAGFSESRRRAAATGKDEISTSENWAINIWTMVLRFVSRSMFLPYRAVFSCT